jgi:Tol biopolymer transport system component
MSPATRKEKQMLKAAMQTVGMASLCVALTAVAVLSTLAISAKAKRTTGDKGNERIVFASDRISGRGTDNPERDLEIFAMSSEGKKLEQLTSNAVDDFEPTYSSDEKLLFVSQNVKPSNPEGDSEVYVMNRDGTNPRNLTNTIGAVSDQDPRFSPDDQQIAFTSFGKQPSNAEGNFEIYLMNADGSEQRNLTNNADLSEFVSDCYCDGREIAYSSFGAQPSNPEGDAEMYVMNGLYGTDQRNLSRTGSDGSDVQPDLETAVNDERQHKMNRNR